MSVKIKAVVFDYGGVMTSSTAPDRVIALAREKGIAWDVIACGFAAHRLDYDAGRITLAEMYALIWRDAGLEVDAATIAAFLKADDESWVFRNDRTVEWMRTLKSRGFKVGILTNMSPAFAANWFRPKYADVLAFVDALVVSGDVGIVKPQREIYDLMRERIGVPADGICFFDDAEKNVRAAREAGWNALLFAGNDRAEADFAALAGLAG